MFISSPINTFKKSAIKGVIYNQFNFLNITDTCRRSPFVHKEFKMSDDEVHLRPKAIGRRPTRRSTILAKFFEGVKKSFAEDYFKPSHVLIIRKVRNVSTELPRNTKLITKPQDISQYLAILW